MTTSQYVSLHVLKCLCMYNFQALVLLPNVQGQVQTLNSEADHGMCAAVGFTQNPKLQAAVCGTYGKAALQHTLP